MVGAFFLVSELHVDLFQQEGSNLLTDRPVYTKSLTGPTLVLQDKFIHQIVDVTSP